MKHLLFTFVMLTIIASCFCSVAKVKADALGPPNILSYPGAISSDSFAIFSPQNTTYDESSILLNFTAQADHGIYDVGYSIDYGQIQRVTNLTQISEDPAPYLEMPPYIRVTDLGTVVLQGLSNGKHTLTVYNGFQYYGVDARYDVSGEVKIQFSINAPSVSIVYPTNNTVFDVSIEGVLFQLRYETNNPLSWAGFSIDGGSNVTCIGNNTDYSNFPHFQNSGYHTLTLYDNDTAGKWAIPQTVTYLVNVHPDLTGVPNKPSPTKALIQSLPIVTLVVVVLAATVTSLLLFRRHQKTASVKSTLESANIV
jgi:hypothetical protein